MLYVCNITLEELLSENFSLALSLIYIVLLVNSIQVNFILLNWVDNIIICIHILVKKVIELWCQSMISAYFFGDLMITLLRLDILDDKYQIKSGK